MRVDEAPEHPHHASLFRMNTVPPSFRLPVYGWSTDGVMGTKYQTNTKHLLSLSPLQGNYNRCCKSEQIEQCSRYENVQPTKILGLKCQRNI